MSDTERRLGPITVQWGKDRYTYYVIGDLLYSEWDSGSTKIKTSWSLRGLSPHLGKTTGRSTGTDKTVRVSMLLLASSVVVFFSDYNSAIPLLAPLLLGLGSWWLVTAVRKIHPRTWTVLRKISGEEIHSMVQPEEETEYWVKFEKGLSEAIVEENTHET